MSIAYEEFLATKSVEDKSTGFEATDINPMLFDFQQAITRWSLSRGRAAIFADCGLGKTPMQLEWASQVMRQTQGRVMIFTPLAVADQTCEQGGKFHIPVKHVRTQDECEGPGIYVSNYERIEKFDPAAFAGVVLDESSIIKNQDGKTRRHLIDVWGRIPYRLCCTATPSPNDIMELGNHCEFLGVMSMAEMLAMFFHHDGGETSKWALKPHAAKPFWAFVAQWAIYVRHPRDIGFDQPGFDLPEIHFHEHVIEDAPEDRLAMGEIVPSVAVTLSQRRAARKDSIDDRVKVCAEVVAKTPGEPFLIWCDLNSESAMIADAIPGCVEVKGADDDEHKETAMLGFAHGNPLVMVTKPSIGGFGMNWQNCCHTAFVGLSDSWERYYQAIRRFYRFGQTKPVHVHVITHEREGAVVENIKRKEAQAHMMAEEMVANMREVQTANVHGQSRMRTEYRTAVHEGERFTLHLEDCVDLSRRLHADSIDYTIFSPPFASLYTYSNSTRDMGNCDDEHEFARHFGYLVKELYRVTKPGRCLSFHCMNLPSTKERDGFIGLKDFRGELIRVFRDAGWIYHSEVCIWKDPVTAMQRTKAIGLLHKQLKKDSCISRQGIADYLVTMRKPGVNPDPVTHTNESFPVQVWQRYASPVWMDINPNDTLQRESARENDGERHICPLQLEVIRRAIDLWTNENDIVFSPFAGIGSEGFVALEKGRRFVGSELKESYWRCAVNNLKTAEAEKTQDLFN